MGRPQNVSDLLDVLSVENTYLITTEGRLVRVWECSGLNLDYRSESYHEAVCAQLEGMLNRLPAESRIQFLVINDPLSWEAWIDRHIAEEYPNPPVEMRGFVEVYRRWLRRRITGNFVQSLRYYVVLSMPGAEENYSGINPLGLFGRGRRKSGRVLTRYEADHTRAVERLESVAGGIRQSLTLMKLAPSPLTGEDMMSLLWSFANPHTSRAVPPPIWRPDITDEGKPNPLTREDVAAELEATGSTEYRWRSLRNRLAQSYLVPHRERISLDSTLQKGFVIRGFDSTGALFLEDLIATGCPFTFSMHIQPLDKSGTRKSLSRKRKALHLGAREDEHRDATPDPEQEDAFEELGQLIRTFSTSQSRMFRVLPVISTSAPNRDALLRNLNQLLGATGGRAGEDVDKCGDLQPELWQATAPLSSNPLAYKSFAVVSANLGDSLPFLSKRCGTSTGPVIGFSAAGQQMVRLDIRAQGLNPKNALLLGNIGSGKTLLAQFLAMSARTKGLPVYILDRSGVKVQQDGFSVLRGHYDDSVRLMGGEVVDVGFSGQCSINPWDLPADRREPDADKLQFLKDLHVLLLGEFREGELRLTKAQETVIEEAIREVYTRTRQPLERDLRQLLCGADDPTARELGGNLGPYCGEGTYAHFLDRPTSIARNNSVQGFNFKSIPPQDDDMAAIAQFVVLEWLDTDLLGNPALLEVDEGWYLRRNRRTASYIDGTTRTSRHSSLSIVNISQRVGDYLGTLASSGTVGSTIAETTPLRILLKQPEGVGAQLRDAFQLTDDELAQIEMLEPEPGDYSMGYISSASNAVEKGVVAVQVPPEVFWLTASEPDERIARDTAIRNFGGDIWKGVEALARNGTELLEEPALRIVRG